MSSMRNWARYGVGPAPLPAASFGGLLFLRDRLGGLGFLRGCRGGGGRLGAARSGAAGARRVARLRAALAGTGVEQLDRLLERHLVGLDVGGKGGVDAGMAHIGTVAALLHHDRSALLGMVAELAARVGAEAAAAR